jgi:hypothetical protein
MAEELPTRLRPRSPRNGAAASPAMETERGERRSAKVVVEHAGDTRCHDVDRSRNRVRCNRCSASHRFEQHETKSVGTAREHEHVGRREARRKLRTESIAEKHGSRETLPERSTIGTITDHDFRARQIEREERRDILLDRDSAEAREDRPLEIETVACRRSEKLGVDAARPEHDVRNASRSSCCRGVATRVRRA